MDQTYRSNERDKKCVHNFGLEIPWKVVIWKAKQALKANSVLTFVICGQGTLNTLVQGD
jgi:hypothetical protein